MNLLDPASASEKRDRYLVVTIFMNLDLKVSVTVTRTGPDQFTVRPVNPHIRELHSLLPLIVKHASPDHRLRMDRNCDQNKNNKKEDNSVH